MPPVVAQAPPKIWLMMKAFAALVMFALAFAVAAETPAQSEEGPPAWAYPVNPPDFKPPTGRRHSQACSRQHRRFHPYSTA